jgi:hypothetical protein
MSHFVWPFVGLAFATWAVSLGGLAALQSQCGAQVALDLADVNGFSAYQTCKTVYRFYWFIIALEFVVINKFVLALVLSHFAKVRIALVGLLSVVTLLYILLTDSFLTAGSLPDFVTGSPSNRLKTLIAGGIMTATANCFLILAAGYDHEVPVSNVKEKLEIEVAEKTIV